MNLYREIAKAVATKYANTASIPPVEICTFGREYIKDGKPSLQIDGLKAAVNDGAEFWGVTIHNGSKPIAVPAMLKKGLSMSIDFTLIVFGFTKLYDMRLLAGLSDLDCILQTESGIGFRAEWKEYGDSPGRIAQKYFPDQMGAITTRQTEISAAEINYSVELKGFCDIC